MFDNNNIMLWHRMAPLNVLAVWLNRLNSRMSARTQFIFLEGVLFRSEQYQFEFSLITRMYIGHVLLKLWKERNE